MNYQYGCPIGYIDMNTQESFFRSALFRHSHNSMKIIPIGYGYIFQDELPYKNGINHRMCNDDQGICGEMFLNTFDQESSHGIWSREIDENDRDEDEDEDDDFFLWCRRGISTD